MCVVCASIQGVCVLCASIQGVCVLCASIQGVCVCNHEIGRASCRERVSSPV